MNINKTMLFKGIDENDCQRMLKCFQAEEKNYKSGDIICNYSENTDFIGIVTNGSVNVVRGDENGNISILEHIEENGLFGKYFIYPATAGEGIYVVCDCACTILFIESCQITKRCSKACVCHSMVVSNMFDIVTEKSKELSSHLIVLSCRSTREKLMCCFRLLSAQRQSTSFELPFSATALAEYICVDRSAMTRELKKMKEEGIITMNKRKVELLY